MSKILSFLVCFFIAQFSYADLESTAILPKGIYSPNLSYGIFSGIGERFNSNGLIEGAAAQYHIELTGKSLSLLKPELKDMVDQLNDIRPSEKLGDALALGNLDFKVSPILTASVPSIAYGVTDNFTIGFGIPLIHYHNDVSINVSGTSNAAEIKNFVGGMSRELNSALGRLSQAALDLPMELQSVLAARGYRPIRSLDSDSPGDAQISGVYRYFNSYLLKLALRPFLLLPTGKQDDPDDLVDLPTGGQSAVGLYSIHDYFPKSNWVISSSVGYQANFQDTSIKRVPLNESDILPDISRKDTLRRHTGNSTFLEAGSRFSPWFPLTLGAYYDITFKDPDWFDGDKGWNYSILSQDTVSQIHQIKAQLEFSTFSWYRRKLFSLPFLFSYVYGNTINAVNAPLVTSNQIMLRMFF
jgi:hypothetical protein